MAWFLSYLLLSIHGYHVSISSVVFNPDYSAFQITIKSHAHDLEKCLPKIANHTVEIGTNHETKEVDSLISGYLRSHFELFVNDSLVNCHYLGKEVQLDETCWLYLEVSNLSRFDQVKIRNTLFIDHFDDQQNITHLKIGGRSNSVIFDKNKILEQFSIGYDE